jgi:hypothetical protein
LATHIDLELLKMLDITSADVEANRAGTLTGAQRAKLAQMRGCRTKASIMALISMLLPLAILFYVGYTQFDFARDPNGGAMYMVAVGIIAIITLLAMLWTYRQGRALDREDISIVEGAAQTETRQIKVRSSRYPRYELTIDKTRFFLESERALKAFRPGRKYRVYYIKYPAASIILSVEVIG